MIYSNSFLSFLKLIIKLTCSRIDWPRLKINWPIKNKNTGKQTTKTLICVARMKDGRRAQVLSWTSVEG